MEKWVGICLICRKKLIEGNSTGEVEKYLKRHVEEKHKDILEGWENIDYYEVVRKDFYEKHKKRYYEKYLSV
ncbi:hypothetical protein DRN69_00170 [Candidatus Pacearchaeota archaeon]|nr:MAG: hypothetical protein DRN69_00170 [Candidatus Pacearchaeota archaeon]